MMSFKSLRRLVYLAALVFFAFFELSRLDKVRRTFEFFTFDRGEALVENRMLPRSPSRELEVRDYVEEALLGPATLNSAPLLAKGTRLGSFMFREGTVFAGFTKEAALPVPEAKTGVYEGLLTLNSGLRRNFSYVDDVVFFIDGNEVFFKEFEDKFEKKTE